MTICLLSYSDDRDGDYAAAYRLHQGLRQVGMESNLFFGNKTRDDHSVLSTDNRFAKG